MKRPSRVLHIVPALFGWENVFGGAERYALELARTMAGRVPTTLIAFGARPARFQLGDLQIHVLRNWIHAGRYKHNPFTPVLLSHLARADIIHIHQPETLAASLALPLARVSGKKIFSSHLGGAGTGLHRLIDVTSWYDGHLHISEFSRQAFGHKDLPTARVIHGGVDAIRYAPGPDVKRTGEVLFMGRLLPHKGINYLIEAMDTETPLTIVGRPWKHAQKFDLLLQELARGKQVRFLTREARESTSWPPEEEDAPIIDACRRALCVVLPSVHKTVYGDEIPIPELLGLVLLEGMACGTPAIATNICSMPEVVEDGVTGFLVPPNDAGALREKIQWLKDHPDDAERMGWAARQRVLDMFTWDLVVDRCLDAYGINKAVETTAPTP